MYLAVTECAGECILGKNLALDLAECDSTDTRQAFDILPISGDVGFVVKASNGGCIQQDDCGSSNQVILGACDNLEAQLAEVNGHLFFYGCWTVDDLDDEGYFALADGTCSSTTTTGSITADYDLDGANIMYMDACTVGKVNGIDA